MFLSYSAKTKYISQWIKESLPYLTIKRFQPAYKGILVMLHLIYLPASRTRYTFHFIPNDTSELKCCYHAPKARVHQPVDPDVPTPSHRTKKVSASGSKRSYRITPYQGYQPVDSNVPTPPHRTKYITQLIQTFLPYHIVRTVSASGSKRSYRIILSKLCRSVDRNVLALS